MRLRRVALIAIPVGVAALALGTYLFSLYGQLERTFSQQEQFVPTRIYSDVVRLAAPETRGNVEERLSALAYAPVVNGEKLVFTLHPIQYPTYLVPEGHPVLDRASQPVTLTFDGIKPDSVLLSIHLGEFEIPDLYLEPELVTTLSHSGEGGEKKEIREPVKFENVPSHVWKAIIAVEDQHFLEHGGFDPRGLARALLVNLRRRSFAQGGSTITQQLVKNLTARRGKSLFRKGNELLLSVLLEMRFPKEQILERYLNEVYLGQVGSMEVHGVAEGAKYFFGKRLEDLNLPETALMAGLIRGPGYYSPYRYRDRALERARLVLRKMVETGQIAQGEADAAMRLPIHLAPPQTVSNKAPYFTDFVKAELIRQVKDQFKSSEIEIVSAGYRVYTTLDVRMNSVAQRSVAEGVQALEKKLGIPAGSPMSLRLEGALATVEQSTGAIRALVGGRGYAQSTFNRILNMKRQVGSTFKPFVYLAAFEKGEDPRGVPYGPGHPAEDAPWKLTYEKGKRIWSPRNYEKEHKGWVSHRVSLAHSINTATARLGVEVGIPRVAAAARAVGIESQLPEVPSLSLGVAELSPVELLRAYATIANHGSQQELSVIRGITHDDGKLYMRNVVRSKQAFAPGPCDLLTDMLQSVFHEGTAAEAIRLGFDRPAAGKTGTTSSHRDAWFAGYTPQLTTVVWVGADQDGEAPKESKDARKPGFKLTGATSALPIWVRFMRGALEGDPPASFPISEHLTTVRIDSHSGKLATAWCQDSQVKVERYVSGHEPKAEACEAGWPPSVKETTLE